MSRKPCIASTGLGLAASLLAGCAIGVGNGGPRTAVIIPDYDRGYAAGFSDGKADGAARQRAAIVAHLQQQVMPYTHPPCERGESWLNKYGNIPRTRYARAREREMQLKLECAARFERLTTHIQQAVRRFSHD